MNQHLAYFNTGERENAIEGWVYIDERISTSLGPQAFGSRRCNPYGLAGGEGVESNDDKILPAFPRKLR